MTRIKRLPNPQPMMLELPPAFGSWLRTAREECGLQQKDIAKLLGVTETAVSLWETGERRVTADVLWKYGVICSYTFKIGVDSSYETNPKEG